MTFSATHLFSAICNALYWVTNLGSAIKSAPACDKVALSLEVVMAVSSSVTTGLRASGVISAPELPPLPVASVRQTLCPPACCMAVDSVPCAWTEALA